jgi:hypothetical protein
MPFDGIAHLKGKNFAPIKPLQNLKATAKDVKANPSNLCAFLRDKVQYIDSQYTDEWQQQIEQAHTIQNLRSGKLVMKRDLGGNGYVFLRRLENAAAGMRSNFPMFPQNSEALKAKWCKSRPQMKAEAFGDGYRTELVLDRLNLIIKYYFKRIFTGDYENAEALSAQDYGTYITQLYYDQGLNQIKKAIPIIRNETKTVVPGFGACLTCGFEGHPKDFTHKGEMYPRCPKCGGYQTTKMVDDFKAEVPTVVGTDNVVQGDITGRLLNWGATRYDAHNFAHLSSYFSYMEYAPLRLIQQMFGEEIELSAMESSDYGLQMLDMLSARGGNTEGLGENDHAGGTHNGGERVPLRTVWLKPEEYMGVRLSEPEETLAGTIPADVPLEEIFPKSICFTALEDMRVIPYICGEDVKIASSAYLVMSHSGIGKGVSDIVDIAKDLNEIHSMAMAGLKRYGASGIAIRANSGVTQENVRDLFKPNRAVFIDGGANGDDISKLITQVQMNPVNPVLGQYQIALSNLFNMASMNADFTQGMVQDVDINTLGGQQLAHSKNEEQKGSIFTGKISHRGQAAGHIIDLVREHMKLEKWMAVTDDRHGKTRGKMVSGRDIPKEKLHFEAVPDSEIPTNTAEKKFAARELIEKSGGILPLIQARQADPEMTGWVAEQYSLQLPMLDQDEMRIVCLDRVDNIKELAEVFASPQEIIMNLRKKLAVREEQHVMKGQFLSKILDDDETLEWNPLVRYTIEMLIERHFDLEGEAQGRNQVIAQVSMAKAQAEAQIAQQRIMQPLIDEQRGLQQEDQEQQMLMQLGQEIIGDEKDQLAHERKMEEMQAQGDINSEQAEASDARAESASSNDAVRQLDIEREKIRMQPPVQNTKGKK